MPQSSYDASRWRAIEAQHEQLLDLLHLLARFVDRPEAAHEAYRLLADLKALFEEHCRDEEALMAEVEYPNFTGHRWEHQILLQDLTDVTDAVGSASALNERQLRVLHTVISDHMVETDSKMDSFLGVTFER